MTANKRHTADLKHCPRCKQNLLRSEFPKSTKTPDGLHCYCKPCKKAYSLKWYHKNKDKAKNSRLKYQFGITLDQYNEMLSAQNGCCAICKSNQPTGYGSWHVDHCHTTNKIRGLLCSKCNHALGLLNDDISLFQNAIEYLNRAAR